MGTKGVAQAEPARLFKKKRFSVHVNLFKNVFLEIDFRFVMQLIFNLILINVFVVVCIAIFSTLVSVETTTNQLKMFSFGDRKNIILRP